MSDWVCTSCKAKIPNPHPGGPGLQRCKCGAFSWYMAAASPFATTTPVVTHSSGRFTVYK
jgi:hypothetical protein